MKITEIEVPKIRVFKVRFNYIQTAVDSFNYGSSDYEIFKSVIERIDYMDKVITEDTICIIQVKSWGSYPFIESQWDHFILNNGT